MDGGVLLDGLALLVRELALFAAFGFLVLGASDLLVDFIWIGLKLKRLLLRVRPASLESLPPPKSPGRLAIFVPTWREEAVIGKMLARALRVWNGADFRIFVGCYPNDAATIAAVEAIDDRRVQMVIGAREGPTTKADNLNSLWCALRVAEARGDAFKAVILHDAEDVVHSAELALFDRMIERFDLVQLPVLPLPDPGSRLTAGSYLDEFAESHGKELVVREALGAGIPSAGVGCAISREAIGLLAAANDAPFDAESITEDYEMGLKLHALGRRAAFVRLPAGESGGVVATREHFPATWRAAVTQKSRWIAGIALSGWDRLRRGRRPRRTLDAPARPPDPARRFAARCSLPHLARDAASGLRCRPSQASDCAHDAIARHAHDGRSGPARLAPRHAFRLRGARLWIHRRAACRAARYRQQRHRDHGRARGPVPLRPRPPHRRGGVGQDDPRLS